MTSYTEYLFALAATAPAPTQRPPLPDPEDAGGWLCCFWKSVADAMGGPTVFVPTEAGIVAVVDELFGHCLFQQTLGHASHIMEHFALSYLPAASPAFRDLWDRVIIPAWRRHADIHQLVSTEQNHDQHTE